MNTQLTPLQIYNMKVAQQEAKAKNCAEPSPAVWFVAPVALTTK
jgi:hypothetical protein